MTEFASTSRGDRIAYDRHGDGPGVVFVAGAGRSRSGDEMTAETARALGARGVTAVVFDRLGRNESAAEGVLDLDRELDAVAAAIDAAGGSAVLVGHSSGCAIALAATVRGLPVDGLVLWEAPIRDDRDGTREWVDRFEELLDAGRLEDAQAWYMRDMPPEWLEGARRSPAWPAIYGQSPTLRADGQALRWAASAPLAELIGGIRVPVLSVDGTETQDVMLRSQQLILAALPGAIGERVTGAHHSWEPEAMAARIAVFLDAVTPAPQSPPIHATSQNRRDEWRSSTPT